MVFLWKPSLSIDGPFEEFVKNHFEGTPFITGILTIAHRFYIKEKSSSIRKALKFALAYNLTPQITFVKSWESDAHLDGQIDD